MVGRNKGTNKDRIKQQGPGNKDSLGSRASGTAGGVCLRWWARGIGMGMCRRREI